MRGERPSSSPTFWVGSPREPLAFRRLSWCSRFFCCSRARVRLRHLLAIDPENYTAHYNLGVLATLAGEWEDSERHLRAALEADPSAAEAHNTLGSLYLMRKELERAREEFGQAIRLEPKFAWAHYNLGMVFRQQKKDVEAAREFRQALAADPQFRAAREALDRLNHLKD